MPNQTTPAIHFPKPQTLQYFIGPQKMPFFVNQVQEEEQIEYDSPPPTTIEGIEIIGDDGLKLNTEQASFSSAEVLTAFCVVGLLLVVSLSKLIKR